MKNLAIVTRADSGVQNWINLTHNAMRRYAEQCNADFIVLSGPAKITVPHHSGIPSNYYRTLRIAKLLDVYDRIIHLDTDMLINKDTPNLFKIVPDNKIGGVREDVGTRKLGRINKMTEIQQEYGNLNWRDIYINEGCFIVSKMHKDIFLPHENKLWTGWAYTQTHMNYKIKKNNFEVFDIGYKWNHMTMFSESWNNSPDRFESHIIHYAGGGVFEKDRFDNKFDQALSDYKKIYGEKWK